MKKILIIALILASCSKSKQPICYQCQGTDGIGTNMGKEICTTGNPESEIGSQPNGTGSKITWHCKQK